MQFILGFELTSTPRSIIIVYTLTART